MGEFGNTTLNRNNDDFNHPEGDYVYIENILVYIFFLASVFIG